MARKKNDNWVELKDQPVPEGSHLLEVDDLKMYFHTQDGVVKAVDGVSYTLDRGETLGVVADVADKIMVMYAGSPVEFGTADEIFYNPVHPYTWGLIRSIPEPLQNEKKPLTPIKGNPPSLVNVPTGCSFSPRCPYATERCRTEKPARWTSETGHYSTCHYSMDEEFVRANAPRSVRHRDIVGTPTYVDQNAAEEDLRIVEAAGSPQSLTEGEE